MSDKQPVLRTGTVSAGIIYACLFAVLALMFLFLGFWKTLFVVLFAAVGFFLGRVEKKEEAVRSMINRFLPPKNE